MSIKTGDAQQAVTTTQQSAAPSSVDDIARSMLVETDGGQSGAAPAAKTASRPKVEPPAASSGGADDTVTDHVTEDDTLLGQSATDEVADDEGQSDAEKQDVDILDEIFAADDDRGDEGQDDVLDTSKLTDDVKLTVTVDGEEQEVTLGDLKRRYAGEGAIEKRLQQATETRKVVVEDYQRSRQLTAALLEKFGTVLFARTIEAPPEELRQKDPAKYLLQRDMFEREGKAIEGLQSELKGLMTQLDEVAEKQRLEHRKAAAQELVRIMPVLADKEKGPKVRDALIEAAREIGYTPEQIAACDDPLMFKTVALAARELKRMKGISSAKTDIKTRNMPVTGKARKPAQSSATRQHAALMAKARQTGSMDDIAATMLMQAPKKR
jgi:hypothetical protein